jgi:hypothetical protein
MLTICHLQRVSTSHSPTSSVAGSIQFLSTPDSVERLDSPDSKLRWERARIPRRGQAAQEYKSSQLVEGGSIEDPWKVSPQLGGEREMEWEDLSGGYSGFALVG